jgi:pyruvate/2-oxoglutarate dehydrogenase complex dihydrolipoamide dehydrogenase (E3) component
MNQQFDLIVLGSGSGARDGANRAREDFGASVALVEQIRWGGSCPNVACKPTKAYLVAAELAHDVNTIADRLGIEVGSARANLARVRARKDELIVGAETWMERLHEKGHTPFDGIGSFVDAQTIEVNGDRLTAERILIATGSRTVVPPIEGLGDVGWIDHVTALDLTEVPESLLVLGAGPVGLEFAQIFSRLRLARDPRPARRPHLAAFRCDRDGRADRGSGGGRDRDQDGRDCLPRPPRRRRDRRHDRR